MAKKAEKINKKTIVGICIAAVVSIAIIIVAIVVHNNKLDDSFFVSDGSKYVLTLESDGTSSDDEYTPIKTHLVYFYSGDKITELKAYYEYADSATAKSAADYIKENYSDDEYEKISINGKYLIFTADESEYENLTAPEVKEQIELMESMQNIGDENYDYEEEEDEEEADEENKDDNE